MHRLAPAAAALALLATSPVLAHPSTAAAPPADAAAEADAGWDLDAAKAALETVDAFRAAMARGDATAAAALLADDLVVYEGGHFENSKAEYVAGHLPHDIAFMAEIPGETTRTSVRAAGDLAWVMREGTTKGDYRGRAIDKISAETIVLRRTADGWRIIHIHWSSRDAPRPAS